MAQKYPKQNLVFPILGLHEGVGYDIQPPGTTADALNVRGYDALKQRLRGGRRPGQSKWHSAQINGDAPIQLMEKVVQAREPDLIAATPSLLLADYTVAAASPDFLGDWLQANRLSTQVFPESLTTQWFVEAGLPKAIVGKHTASGTVGTRFLKSGWRTTRDMTVTYKLEPTTVGLLSVDDRLAGAGIMFRSSVTAHSHFRGYFVVVSLDKVKFVVDRIQGNTTTSLVATSPDFDVSGSTTAVDGLTIRVDWTSDSVVSITIAWSDTTEQATDSKWLGDTFTFTDGSNLIGDEYTYGGPLIGASTLAIGERRITNIAVTFEKPKAPNVLFSINDHDDNPSGGGRYELPAGWSTWECNASGVVALEQDGYQHSAVPWALSVDTINEQMVGSNAIGGAITRDFIRRTVTPTVRQSIELRVTNDGRGKQELSAAFGVSDDLSKYIAVTIETRASSGAPANMVAEIRAMTITIFGTAKTVVQSIAVQTYPGTPFVYSLDKAGHWVRVDFDGAILTISIAGGFHSSYTLTQTDLDNLGYTSTTVPMRNAIAADKGHQVRIIEFDESEKPSIQDQLVVVAGGDIKIIEDGVLSDPSGGTLAVSATLYAVQAQSAFGRVFFVDGNVMKYYRFATNTVSNWVATSGTTPAKARLIALYRGRVVVSGLQSDPHNYFMPKLGDPFDFDYSPATPSVIQAVAGNNSDAGLIGDVITALIPFGDDYMWIGGDHTIWQMTGDPAAGGTIDQVTDKTGILFGKAWTKNPRNELFFAAVDGIYRAVPNELPENMTKGRLDKRIRDIDTSLYRVFLEWDYLRWGLVVMYMAIDVTVKNIAFFWDARSDAWWPDEYSATHGPSSIFAFDGLASNDQAMLLGGRDGYIRKVDDDADDDDGLAITSRVRFAPLIAPDHASEVVTGTVIPVLAKDSGPVDLKIYTGQTAEECVTATNPRVKRALLRGGRNPLIRQRVRGYAIQHELSQTAARSRWALENLTVEFEPGGIARKHVARPMNG